MSAVEEDLLIRQRGHCNLCRYRCRSRDASHGGHSSGYCSCVFHLLVFLHLEFSALSNIMADEFAMHAAFPLLVCVLAFVPLSLVLILLLLWLLFADLALLSSFSVEGSCAFPRLMDAGFFVSQNAHLDVFRCLFSSAQIVEHNFEYTM